MSLTTTRTLAERPAHSYKGSLYVLPSDDEERQRLFIQHKLFTRLLSDRLFLPPMSFSEGDEVLDIGTGAGAWLCDARTHLPDSVQIYGIDIESRLFPGYSALASNVHLSVCSGTDLPAYWSSKFALIHQRLLICAYTRDQWQRNIEEMFRVLKPGGYAQLIEVGPEWRSGPKTSKHVLFLDSFFESKGMLFRCGVYIADMLRAAGFTDVRCEEVVMKLGKWGGEDGIQGRNMTMGAWRGMRDAVMRAGGCGRFSSGEEFERAIDEVAEEWDDTEGSHTAVRVFCARKPV